MREIEFRGQCAFSGSLRYGFYRKHNNNHIIVTEEGDESIILIKTLGQYIGHKDKNNVKIFENDRVLYDGVLGNVFYSEDLAMFMVRFDYTNSVYNFDTLDRDVEVV